VWVIHSTTLWSSNDAGSSTNGSAQQYKCDRLAVTPSLADAASSLTQQKLPTAAPYTVYNWTMQNTCLENSDGGYIPLKAACAVMYEGRSHFAVKAQGTVSGLCTQHAGSAKALTVECVPDVHA
jgi:hypothetical protein